MLCAELKGWCRILLSVQDQQRSPSFPNISEERLALRHHFRPFRRWEINLIDDRKWRDANLREITNWLLRRAVIFDGPNLTASQAAIFASVRVVFLDCPFLDCLNHGVTTSTVGVTTFTNHSVKLPCGCYLLLLSSLILQYHCFYFSRSFHLCLDIWGPKPLFFFLYKASLYCLVPQPFLFMLRYFFFLSVCIYRLMYCSQTHSCSSRYWSIY